MAAHIAETGKSHSCVSLQVQGANTPFEVIGRSIADACDRMMSGKARFRVVLTMT